MTSNTFHFRCAVCDQGFRDLGQLIIHVETKHTEALQRATKGAQ